MLKFLFSIFSLLGNLYTLIKRSKLKPIQPDKFLYDKMILTKMIIYYAILRHCEMCTNVPLINLRTSNMIAKIKY